MFFPVGGCECKENISPSLGLGERECAAYLEEDGEVYTYVSRPILIYIFCWRFVLYCCGRRSVFGHVHVCLSDGAGARWFTDDV